MRHRLAQWLVFAASAIYSVTLAQTPAPTHEDPAEKCLRILRYGDLHHPYNPTKADAVLALGLLRAEQAVPTLLEHLAGESNDNLRMQIARALGWIRSAKAVPALKEVAMKDRYLHARRVAADALKEITGVEHEYDRTGEAEARKRIGDILEAKRSGREKANEAAEPTSKGITTPAAQESRRP